MGDSVSDIQSLAERLSRLEATVGAMKSRNDKLTSSKKTGGKDDWRTPAHITEAIASAYGPIDMDPCASPYANHQFARNNFTGIDGCINGLLATWTTSRGVVFVNPPYSQMAAWAKACVFWAQRGVVIVALVRNSRARWFKLMRQHCHGVIEHPSRVKFDGGDNSPAPFDSIYFVFNQDPQLLFEALGCTDEHAMYVPSTKAAA